ncbi:hypothetical protein [Novosphingobium sp. JCM 18896]|uniref:hypothetical protein n=1 Tax=Novosphingobium sp. JCM 18896 TaxID=2989731 RepID=UPI00222256A0|nr:hypothetical protein [Novosphingobium sp. JCM 18896]MCW1432463.1 hypothetical protein [Novosphingobium sp. JCM 18896]
MDHFVVEANKAVVGVAVRVAGGFRFFYSDPRFRALDGQVFRRARALAHTVGEMALRMSKLEEGHAAGGSTVH